MVDEKAKKRVKSGPMVVHCGFETSNDHAASSISFGRGGINDLLPLLLVVYKPHNMLIDCKAGEQTGNETLRDWLKSEFPVDDNVRHEKYIRMCHQVSFMRGAGFRATEPHQQTQPTVRKAKECSISYTHFDVVFRALLARLWYVGLNGICAFKESGKCREHNVRREDREENIYRSS